MRVVALLVLACAIPLAGCAAEEAATAGRSTGPTVSASVLSSAEYGVDLVLPPGWTGTPATEPWDGGDVDHSAAYADRVFGPDQQIVFVIGTPTDLDAERYADEHLAWLTANRSCADPSTRVPAQVDGEPAVRVALHCDPGVYGPTLVLKAISVRDGRALVVTSFTPDGREATDVATFDALLEGLSWR